MGARTSTAASPGDHTHEERDLVQLESEMRRADDARISCEGPRSSKKTRDGSLAWPVDGVIISAFGQRDGAPHEGIDIAAPAGTLIRASAPGEVIFAGERSGYGRMVIVRHEDDRVTVYAHNAKNCIEEGARVEQGEIIAVVGQSGGATSPAVHFEVRVGQRPVNPVKHLAE
jgi:murein DD-endopeptidase MepM/ murein hydrolase activator NlpD